MPTTSAIELGQYEVPTNLPVFHCYLGAVNDQLTLAREAIEELRVSHPESTPSNVHSVYMSPWKSHQLNAKFGPLTQTVRELALRASKQFLVTDMAQLNLDLAVTDCWGAIYEESDHTLIHTHFPSDFVAVIYLEAGANCAPIVFDNHLAITPRPGWMMLFPGMLRHHVPENHDARVIVAMNLLKLPSFGHA
ncbi:MAG: hypothetical protein EBT08_02425 [Betaproteobacteria bacterium]|nr:hypothetical protein [Betaproteobacteria bacterium]